MTEEKGIQITRGSKEVSKISSQNGIEISRSGKPINGAVPELLDLEFRCASTRKSYRILLEARRTAQTNRYKVISILKGESGPQSKAVSSSSVRKLDININEIDGIHSVKCPHCGGGKSAMIQCGCGGLSCGGGVRSEGNKQYQECPWCRSVGVIGGYIEKLTGERSTSRRGLSSKGSSKQQIRITDEVQKLPPGNKQIKIQ